MLICDLSILDYYGKQQLDEVLRPLALAWRQAVVLLALDRISGAGLPLLSRMLQTDKGNVSRLLNGMERDGLLVRQVSHEDARRKALKLTEQGSALVNQVKQAMKNWEMECYQGMTPQQVDTYRQLNRMVMENIYKGRVSSREED